MKNKLIRVNENFSEVLKKIRYERLKKDIDMDRRLRSFPDLTKMIVNCPSFERIKFELENIPLKSDLERRRKK